MSTKVIDLLNQARARELAAINQYMIQHYELEDSKFGKLASKMKEIAIQEMKHAEACAERILFLNGTPISKPDMSPKTKEEIPAMMQTDIALEQQAIKLYNEAAGVCAQEGDNVSRNLFVQFLEEEEGHLDEFQNIADHIDKLGSAYLATLTS